MVRLAVEAQALSALLLMLAQSQQAAVDSGDALEAVKWTDLEATASMALRALQAQLRSLPGHAPEAAQAAPEAAPAVEEPPADEPPPLPADEGEQAAAAGSLPGIAYGSSSGSEEDEEEEGELPQAPPLPVEAALPEPESAAPLPDGYAAPQAALFDMPAAEADAPPLPGEAVPMPLPAEALVPVPALPALPMPAEPPAADAEPSAGAATSGAAGPKKRKVGGAAEVASKKARSGGGSGTAAIAAAAGGGHSKLGKGAASLINKWQKVAKQVSELSWRHLTTWS